MTIALGATAPDFSLPGTDGTGSDDGRRDYSLSEFDGMVRVLVFYPADASPVCTVQLNTYTAGHRPVRRGRCPGARDQPAVGRRPRRASPPTTAASPSRCSPTSTTRSARRTASSGPMGFYRRSVFVIDAAGIVRYAHRSTAGLTFRPTEELVAAVEAASSSADHG